MSSRPSCNGSNSNALGNPSFDSRPTLSRSEAEQVYDNFASAKSNQTGGNDASSRYGGPAVSALLELAHFDDASQVLDYGCGQGKLAELVLSSQNSTSKQPLLQWRGIDQSYNMVQRFQERCVSRFPKQCRVQHLKSGNPLDVSVEKSSIDRFVSTYCLDLLSEQDMYRVLDLAEHSLNPDRGLLLLAGITWGYKASFRTFVMTLVWEILYIIQRKRVGGCRPQALQPYLEARGWRIEKVVQTLPKGFPWMASEVISARPAATRSSNKES